MSRFNTSSAVSSLALLLATSTSLAQGTLLPPKGNTEVRMPAQEEVTGAQLKAREALGRIPEASVARQQFGGAMPKIDALPIPPVRAPDIASIAEKYREIGKAAAAQQESTPNLLVLVSLSMPREALERVIIQSERTGAQLVFRGFRGNSMTRMSEEIQAILAGRNVAASIHPPAFQQFSVARVPAVVLARSGAGSVMEDGCSNGDTFVKVTGDVTLDHALEYIERKSPAWASVARGYRVKLSGSAFQ